MGNIFENTMENIWNGDKYTNFRKRLKASVYDPSYQPEFCKGCLKYTNPNDMNMFSKVKAILKYPFLK